MKNFYDLVKTGSSSSYVAQAPIVAFNERNTTIGAQMVRSLKFPIKPEELTPIMTKKNMETYV